MLYSFSAGELSRALKAFPFLVFIIRSSLLQSFPGDSASSVIPEDRCA